MTSLIPRYIDGVDRIVVELKCLPIPSLIVWSASCIGLKVNELSHTYVYCDSVRLTSVSIFEGLSWSGLIAIRRIHVSYSSSSIFLSKSHDCWLDRFCLSGFFSSSFLDGENMFDMIERKLNHHFHVLIDSVVFLSDSFVELGDRHICSDNNSSASILENALKMLSIGSDSSESYVLSGNDDGLDKTKYHHWMYFHSSRYLGWGIGSTTHHG